MGGVEEGNDHAGGATEGRCKMLLKEGVFIFRLIVSFREQ